MKRLVIGLSLVLGMVFLSGCGLFGGSEEIPYCEENPDAETCIDDIIEVDCEEFPLDESCPVPDRFEETYQIIKGIENTDINTLEESQNYISSIMDKFLLDKESLDTIQTELFSNIYSSGMDRIEMKEYITEELIIVIPDEIATLTYTNVLNNFAILGESFVEDEIVENSNSLSSSQYFVIANETSFKLRVQRETSELSSDLSYSFVINENRYVYEWMMTTTTDTKVSFKYFLYDSEIGSIEVVFDSIDQSMEYSLKDYNLESNTIDYSNYLVDGDRTVTKSHVDLNYQFMDTYRLSESIVKETSESYTITQLQDNVPIVSLTNTIGQENNEIKASYNVKYLDGWTDLWGDSIYNITHYYNAYRPDDTFFYQDLLTMYCDKYFTEDDLTESNFRNVFGINTFKGGNFSEIQSRFNYGVSQLDTMTVFQLKDGLINDQNASSYVKALSDSMSSMLVEQMIDFGLYDAIDVVAFEEISNQVDCETSPEFIYCPYIEPTVVPDFGSTFPENETIETFDDLLIPLFDLSYYIRGEEAYYTDKDVYFYLDTRVYDTYDPTLVGDVKEAVTYTRDKLVETNQIDLMVAELYGRQFQYLSIVDELRTSVLNCDGFVEGEYFRCENDPDNMFRLFVYEDGVFYYQEKFYSFVEGMENPSIFVTYLEADLSPSQEKIIYLEASQDTNGRMSLQYLNFDSVNGFRKFTLDRNSSFEELYITNIDLAMNEYEEFGYHINNSYNYNDEAYYYTRISEEDQLMYTTGNMRENYFYVFDKSRFQVGIKVNNWINGYTFMVSLESISGWDEMFAHNLYYEGEIVSTATNGYLTYTARGEQKFGYTYDLDISTFVTDLTYEYPGVVFTNEFIGYDSFIALYDQYDNMDSYYLRTETSVTLLGTDYNLEEYSRLEEFYIDSQYFEGLFEYVTEE
jgi:hypothetical protein